MTTISTIGTIRLNVEARELATAWLNAFLATSENEDRAVLYRTLSVEFFPAGLQLVGCDGTMLFRTFVPSADGRSIPRWPEIDEVPEQSVVVRDADHFAQAFMRTLLAATKDGDGTTASIAIEPVDDLQPSLGEELSDEVVTLTACGQRLAVQTYEDRYPDWRGLQYGLSERDRVDGMRLATRLFAIVGKLKGVTAVDCEFSGTARQITIRATGEHEVRGLLMPMRRPHDDTQAKPAKPTAQAVG